MAQPERIDEGTISYDVFLSHNSADKSLVEEFAQLLQDAGVCPFLDKWHLVPGEPWQQGLERALSKSRSCLVCIGPSGLGPWTAEEARVAVDRAARDSSFRVIPVLLPGAEAPERSSLSIFLRQRTWVDLRRGFSDHPEFQNLLEALGSQSAVSLPASETRAASERAATAKGIQGSLAILQSRFIEPLRHTLAGGRGRLIRRQESQKILEALEDSKVQVVVVHGVAGSGKSGVVYEVALELAERQIPFLPVRLDRYELKVSPARLGEDLGLPGSPGKCLALLASEQGAVLILDQLDALRWTSAHSGEALDVCREVMAEALAGQKQIKLVVCCRTFDLEHDPQLRGWERETRNLRRVEVGELSDRDVDEAIRAAGDGQGNLPALRPAERKILRVIQHLQMWLAIYISANQAPEFDTALALMQYFWSNRRDQIHSQGIERARGDEILGQMLSAMGIGARLSAPLHRVDATEVEMGVLQSLCLVLVDPVRRRVSFAHQNYLDYLVARRLLGDLERHHDAILLWLGDKSAQSLFRREQLRLVLSALREERSEFYLPTLRDLLYGKDRVRFHLRQLTLQFLGQLKDPEEDEVELVFDLFRASSWREHILAEVISGNPAWFGRLDDQGTIKAWLESEEWRDAAMRLIRGVAEKSGDRIARLLGPYRGKGEDWSWRIGWALPFEPSADSENLFELRLQLAQDGAYAGEHVNWEGLARANPVRFFLLAAHVLLGMANRLVSKEDESRYARRRPEADWYGFDPAEISVVETEVLLSGWKLLAMSVGLVARAGRADDEEEPTLESFAIRSSFEALEPVVHALRRVGGELLARDWRLFVEMTEEVAGKEPFAQVLLLDSLAGGLAMDGIADWALCWILDDPWRMRLRFRHDDNPWAIAAEIVERYSPICSENVYLRLEAALLDFREPDFARRFRYRHELLQEEPYLLSYRSFAGATPYHLLPKLPERRRSERVRVRILELKRKFGDAGDVFFSGIGKGMGGFVASPISAAEVRNKLSDETWLNIINSRKIRDASIPRRWRVQRGNVLEEASISTFASDLLYATQRQPERFARLALRIPESAPPQFFRSVVSGLAVSSAPDSLSPEEKERWLPASHEALESVLRLVEARGLLSSAEADPSEDVCRILQNHAGLPWSRKSVALLALIATEHANPAPSYFPVGFRNSGGDSADSLETNSLNVTRGAAAYAIASFVFSHPDRLDEVQPAVESLIRDAHPAVRVSAISACLPVLNVDRSRAIGWFLTACESNEAVLSTSAVERFLYYTLHREPEELRGLVERMLVSEKPEVVRLAARRVAAAHLTHGVLSDLYRRCLEGTGAARRGVAELAAGLLGEASFANQAKVALLALADDEDRDVAIEVAQGFRQLDLRLLEEDRVVWVKFARSRAFQAEPSYLLHALERQAGDLRPFADCLLTAGETFCEELAEASRDISTGIAADVHYLVPLLLRLYDQTKYDSAVHQRCLDLWDSLLERRVGEAMGLTREIDRV